MLGVDQRKVRDKGRQEAIQRATIKTRKVIFRESGLKVSVKGRQESLAGCGEMEKFYVSEDLRWGESRAIIR